MVNPCQHFLRGRCRWGDECKYSHEGTPQTQKSSKRGPCFAFAKGECDKGKQCRYSHDPRDQERKRPCHDFAFGTCDRGSQCKYSHDTPAPKHKRPCYDFAAGACHRGNECRYSHDVPVSEDNESDLGRKQADRNPRSRKPASDSQLVQWSYDVKKEMRDIKSAPPLGEKFAGFIQQALALVNDINTRQEAIKTLSSEGGLARLGEMLNTDFTLLADDEMRLFFEEQLLPFFRIIAHDDVRSSSVLEVHLGTMLNYLHGVNGIRSSKVFDATVRSLKHGYRKRAGFEPCLISLSAVLDPKISPLVNDDLRTAAVEMVALADNRALSSNMPTCCKEIKLRLGLRGDISAAKDNKKNDDTHQKPTSELLIDRPGNLSKQGPVMTTISLTSMTFAFCRRWEKSWVNGQSICPAAIPRHGTWEELLAFWTGTFASSARTQLVSCETRSNWSSIACKPVRAGGCRANWRASIQLSQCSNRRRRDGLTQKPAFLPPI